MNRPDYKMLLKEVSRLIASQKADGRNVAITQGVFTQVGGKRLNNKDVEAAWPSVVKALGLVDDGTAALSKAMGYGALAITWTVPGSGYLETAPTNKVQEILQVAATDILKGE